jgi:hypothetical protein
MKGVDINRSLSPLHHPGNEHVGVQRFIGSREDLPDSAQIAAREPSHSSRVHVKFTEPADAW